MARQNIVLQCSGFQRVNNLRAVGQKLGYDRIHALYCLLTEHNARDG